MYIVIELQTTGETTAIPPITTYTNWQQAYAKYHTILAAAAVSTVPKHAAVILNEEGAVIRNESFEHGEAASE